MNFLRLHLPGRRISTRPTLGVIALVALFVSGGAAAMTFAPRQGLLQDVPGERRDRVIIVYLTPYGFEPREAVLKPGNYQLHLRNGSGLGDLQVNLAHTFAPPDTPFSDPGAPKDALPATLGVLQPGQSVITDVTLQPGEVAMTVQSHPGWRFLVAVEP